MRSEGVAIRDQDAIRWLDGRSEAGMVSVKRPQPVASCHDGLSPGTAGGGSTHTEEKV